jgi:hypothetical protein
MGTSLKGKTDAQIANLCDRLPDMVLQKSIYLTAKCGVIKYQVNPCNAPNETPLVENTDWPLGHTILRPSEYRLSRLFLRMAPCYI